MSRSYAARAATLGIPSYDPSPAWRTSRPLTVNGPGAAIEPSVRAPLEARFGADFGAVRVHTDDTAAASARAVGAAAYAVGRDIVFGAGRYQPQSGAGQGLLAHELAHVVQQSRGGGAAPDAEARADRAASQAVQGQPVSARALGGAPVGLQAKPEDGAIPAPTITMNQQLASVEIEPGEAVGKDNPKMVEIASSYKANAGLGSAMRVRLAADLPSAMKYNSAQEAAERSRLAGRMRAIRDTLESLGVPADAIDISPATAYSTSAHGQVSADVSKRTALTPPLLPLVPSAPGPTGPTPQAGPPGPQAAASLPSLDLDLTIGPVTISLPKEVRAKLPIRLGHGKKLVIDLGFEVPAKFSLKITLDGTPHVRLSLKAGAEVDAKDTAVTGSAGLQIETESTVCNAPDPGETREKIKSAGDKLNKAAKEFQDAATDSDKLSKAVDIASAIGEIYEAVDKAKAKCKQVPRATFELGYKRLLSPGNAPDPTKPLDYAGVTATFHF